MKLEFDSPTAFTDGSPIPSADAISYTVFIDTVNPPVKSYPVATSAVAAATKNANGSFHVTVDCVKGDAVGFKPVPGTTYFCTVDDTVNSVASAEDAVLTVAYNPAPEPPANFTVA